MAVSFSLEGKVALVTGASYGIGFAIASAYAQAGATICFNDIKQELVDKGIIIPFFMDRQMTTTHIGIIHQIIMQQSIIMIGLQSAGIHEDVFRIFLIEIISQKH